MTSFLGCLILIFCSNFGILYAAAFRRGINSHPAKFDSYRRVLQILRKPYHSTLETGLMAMSKQTAHRGRWTVTRRLLSTT